MNDVPNDRFEDDDEDDTGTVQDDVIGDEEEGNHEDETMDDVYEEAEELYQANFDRAFTSLCEVLPQNDPEITNAIPMSAYGVGMRLGRALVGNTHVRSMTLRLVPEYMSAPGQDEGVESIALLLQYFREGPAFRSLTLTCGVSMYLRPCFLALSHNPIFESLSLGGVDVDDIPHEELSQLLRTTRSLSKIVMPMLQSQLVAEAFGENQTLRRVILSYDPDAQPAQHGAILQHLHSHPTLCALFIRPTCRSESNMSTARDVALSHCLKATTSLTCLSLSSQTFGKTRMQLFMEGLHTNSSLTRLFLDRCLFDDLAIDVVESFARSIGKASLTPMIELQMEVSHSDVEFNTARLAVLLAAGSPHMTSLDYYWYRSSGNGGNCRVFWSHMEAQASKIRLQQIRQADLPVGAIPALSACIPKLVYLRELCINQTSIVEHPGLCYQFANAVRKSGSLQTLPMDPWFSHVDYMTAFIIIEASLERNRNLPRLLAAAGCDTTLGNHDDESPSESMATEVNLVPTLMLSAVQAPQMAPNQLLTSMLALSESVTGQ